MDRPVAVSRYSPALDRSLARREIDSGRLGRVGTGGLPRKARATCPPRLPGFAFVTLQSSATDSSWSG